MDKYPEAYVTERQKEKQPNIFTNQE